MIGDKLVNKVDVVIPHNQDLMISRQWFEINVV